MGKKAPKSPAAPDPIATAQAQGQANLDAARLNQLSNMTNQVTPYGSLTYENIGPDRWTAYQTLSPAQQHMLNQEQAINMTANDMSQRALWRADATLNTPFTDQGVQQAGFRIDPNWAVPYQGAPQMRASPGVQRLGVEDVRPQDTNQIAQLMMKRANPQFEAQRAGIRSNLINSGVREGSEAWNRAMDDYNRQYSDANIAAQLAAGTEQSRQLQADLASAQNRVGQQQWNVNQQFQHGQQEGAFNFDQEMARNTFQNQLRQAQLGELQMFSDRDTAERQRQLQERITMRQVPLNEMAALATGNQIQQPNFVNTPQFQTQPGNYQDAVYQSYAGQQNAYNQQMQAAMANRAGMFGLLGQGIGIGAFGLAGGFR